MGRGSVLHGTVPVCQISSLRSALLAALRPKLTAESTDKTAQNPKEKEKNQSPTRTCTNSDRHIGMQTRNQIDTLTHTHSQKKKMDRPSVGSTLENSYNKAACNTNVLWHQGWYFLKLWKSSTTDPEVMVESREFGVHVVATCDPMRKKTKLTLCPLWVLQRVSRHVRW